MDQCCEHCNDTPDFTKGRGEFIHELSNCQFHKKDSVLWSQFHPGRLSVASRALAGSVVEQP